MADATAQRTAAEWLPILAKRFDEQSARTKLLRSYMFEDGTFPPLPEMNKNTKPAWEAFQKKACPALAPLIVSSAADRIRYQGVIVGVDQTELETLAKRVARDSLFETAISDAVYAALVDGESYLQTAKDSNGKAVVTAEDRRFTIVAPDPLRPHIARAALKVWRDFDYALDFAFVWDGTSRVLFSRPIADKKKKTFTRIAGTWTAVNTIPVDGVPFAIIRPLASGMGLFEAHVEVINRASWTTLVRLAVTAQQGFPQRFLEGGLPAEDDDGNAINYDGLFTADPGGIWDLPAGVKVSQLSSASIQELLIAERDDRRELAAVTRTSLATINPSDGANQSAEGSLAAKEQTIFMVEQIITRAVQPAAELALVRAIKLESPGTLAEGDTVTVRFAPPQRVSEAEKYQAMTMAKAADVPFRTRMLEIGGFSADEVDRMENERLNDRLDMEALVANATEAGPATDPAAPSGPATTTDVKAQADALGVLIRSGVTADSAAAQAGLDGVKFTGAVPTSLRPAE